MKKTILLSSIFALGAAFATGTDVESGNSLAVLDVTITKVDLALNNRTLVAVPFLGYGTDGAVAVQDIVKTSELGSPSKIYVPTAENTYATWTINKDGSWQHDSGVINVPLNGKATESADTTGGAHTIGRGDSFWLEPNTSGKIYLLGEGPTAAGVSVAKPGWNLIGNTSLQNCTIADGANGDKIVVQVANNNLRYYTYKSGTGWYYVQDNDLMKKYENPTLVPGQGLWYFNGDTSDRNVQW